MLYVSWISFYFFSDAGIEYEIGNYCGRNFRNRRKFELYPRGDLNRKKKKRSCGKRKVYPNLFLFTPNFSQSLGKSEIPTKVSEGEI